MFYSFAAESGADCKLGKRTELCGRGLDYGSGVYAEAGDDTYVDDGASLISETKKSNIEEACADWIASSERKEGDLTVIEDDDNSCFYIVYYISRSYDGSDDDTIKSTLLNQKYSEYIKKYTDEYTVDVEKRFTYR